MLQTKMRKQVNILGQVALLATLYFVSFSATAGWDSRFFPPPQGQLRDGTEFAYDVVASQVVYAVNERYWAINGFAGWDYINVLPSRKPRDYHEVLIETKGAIASIIPQFLNQYETQGPSNLVSWSVTSILAHCSLPTNYFLWTPIRNLMDHPHPRAPGIYMGSMVTNGTNYGWNGMYKVLNELTHTFDDGGVFNTNAFQERISRVESDSVFDAACEAYPDGNWGAAFPCHVGSACFEINYIPTSFAWVSSDRQAASYSGYDAVWEHFLHPISFVEFAESEISRNYTIGYVAAFIGKQYTSFGTNPLIGRNNRAHSYYLDSSDACESPTNQPVLKWIYNGVLSNSYTTTDDIVYEAEEYDAITIGCGPCDAETIENSDGELSSFLFNCGPEINEPDDYNSRCPNVDYIGYIKSPVLNLSSEINRTYKHIIEWDFTYK